MSIVAQNIGSIYDAGLDRTFSPKEIRSLFEDRAHVLWNQGVQAGSRVLIAHGNSIHFYVDLFACWHLGACAVPIDPTSSDAELERIGNFIETPLLLHREAQRFQHTPFPARHTEQLPRPTGSRAEFQSWHEGQNFDLDSEALILFTSGSTSQPKGVVHTFRTILAKIAIYRRAMPAAEWQRTLCVIPTHFVYGLMSNSLGPLFQGCDLIVYPSFDLSILTQLGSLIDRHKITAFCSVPSMWKIVFDFSTKPTEKSLRRIHCAAAPLSRDLWMQIRDWGGGIEVKNVYGATEMGCAITGPIDGQDFHDGLVGRGWDTRVSIMDEHMKEVPMGEIGDVYFQGPSMMKGYFRQPEATAEVLRHGWYRTGDLGRSDAAGDVTLVGRSKYVINKAGMKIYPEDVEAILGTHPDILDVCVFGVDDIVSGQAVGAAVVLRPQPTSQAATSLSQIETWCRTQLASFKTPTKWFELKDLPRTSRGKINRQKLAESLQGKTE